MSSSNGNGLIRIGRKGLSKFQFGDNDGDPVVVIDVVAVNDAWAEEDAKFRDESGKLLAGKSSEHRSATIQFVQGVVAAAGGSMAPDQQKPYRDLHDSLTYTEALMFLARMTEECDKLKGFFAVNTGNGPSPPPSLEVKFSE